MKFTINRKRYQLKATWPEVTLSDAKRLVSIQAEPEEIDAAVQLEGMELSEYMIKAVAVMSDCPEEILRQTEPIHVVVLFDHIRYLIHGIFNLNIEKHVPVTRDKITHKGVEYYMPESLWISEKEIPMHKEPAKHVTEAGNILQMVSELKEKGIEKMDVFCAIYLKESRDEFYDEQKIAHRIDEFQDLPMDVVWDVFFCMYFSLCSYAINFRGSLESQRGVLKRIRNLIHGFLQWLNKALQVIRKKLVGCRYGSWSRYWITTLFKLREQKQNEQNIKQKESK
jgi:hypothetical protein